MILLTSIFAVLAAAFAAKAAMLTGSLKSARSELATWRGRAALPPPPPPSPSSVRLFECRLERSGLLWFPVLTADDGEKLVVGVSSGLPHCVRCVRPLKLVQGPAEQWVCSACEERHGTREADLMATDLVLTQCLREFFARHPDYSPASGLSAPKFEVAAAA
ncbi:MAG: hypothetical protein ACHQ49_16325 [Elusimicrobiota bacterium]